MKLEKGIYVRTKYGKIAKIINIDNETFSDTSYILDIDNSGMWRGKDDFLKSSHNIIDLIEEGDYIKLYTTDLLRVYMSYGKLCINAPGWTEEIPIEKYKDGKILYQILTKETKQLNVYKLGGE